MVPLLKGLDPMTGGVNAACMHMPVRHRHAQTDNAADNRRTGGVLLWLRAQPAGVGDGHWAHHVTPRDEWAVSEQCTQQTHNQV
jgi:hypothetical protein